MTRFRFHKGAFAILVVIIAVMAPLQGRSEQKKPVKVFILAGQSNMQGHGRISMGKDGDLDYAAQQKQFSYLKKAGQWVERPDVWYYHKSGKGVVTKCNLKVGLGANDKSIGPALAFGHVIGDYLDEQVLLIKCAWGGQAIAMTFRPPSSGMPSEEVLEKLLKGAKRRNPKMTMAEFKKVIGSKYRQTLSEVREVLDDLKKHFPDYQGQGYEIAGFFWHQGWNDATNREFAAEYEKNMSNFIQDIRKDLGNKKLPFVIATSGMGGPKATRVAGFLAKSIEPAQMAAAKKHDYCVAVPTRHFQRHKPGRQKSHWHNSAESYCLVGDASARAMIKIIKGK
ncbi:MAG: sialate O-acetylesterase [Gemmataceae bacterium]